MKLIFLLYWLTGPLDSIPKPDSLYFYGANRAKIASNTSAKLGNFAYTNPLNYLNGAGTGIQMFAPLGQPGADPEIALQGNGLYYHNSRILYFGRPYSSTLKDTPPFNIVLNGFPFLGTLADIPSLDIESMEILKDPVSLNMFGGAPLRPVLHIQTKRITKQHFNFSVNTGIAKNGLPEKDLLNPQNFYEYQWEKLRYYLMDTGVNPQDAGTLAAGLWPRDSQGKQNYNGRMVADVHDMLGNPTIYNVPNRDLLSAEGNLNPNARLLNPNNLDWMKTVARTGLRNEIHGSYSSTLGPIQIYASLGYLKEEGWARHSDLSRKNGTISLSYSPVSWLKLGYDGSNTKRKEELPNTTSSNTNPFYFARTVGPIYPVYMQNSQTGEIFQDPKIPYTNALFNTPLKNEVVQNASSTKSLNRGFLQFSPLSWLTWQSNIGANKHISDHETDISNAPSNPIQTTIYQNTRFSLQQHLLNLDKKTGSIHIQLTTGYEYFKRKFIQNTDSYSNEQVTELIPISTTTLQINENRESYFTHLDLSFKDLFRVESSLRKNTSRQDKTTHTYAAYWRPKIKNKVFEVHAAWGENSKMPDTFTLHDKSSGTYFSPSRSTFTTGINAGTFLKFTYFKRVNKEIILHLPYNAKHYETLSYANSGLEMELGALIVENKQLQWDSRIFLTLQKNEVISMPKNIPTFLHEEYVAQQDYPLNAYFLRPYAGLDPATGQPTYRLPDGGVTTTEGLSHLEISKRSPHPKFYGSWVNHWQFKQVELRIVMNYQMGGWNQDQDHRLHSNSYLNYRTEVLTMPVAAFSGSTTNFSDRWLTRSDYFSLNHVHLSYRFNRHISLQLNGENLYFWTREKGLNPLNYGSDLYTYTLARRINLGAQFSL